MVDSAACFRKQILELGLGALTDPMEKKGWTFFGAFCFATQFTPGVPTDPDRVKKDIVVPLLGEDEESTLYMYMPALRRLHFLFYLFMMKDMQNRTEKADDDVKPVKIPAAERDSRWRTMKGKYVGLTMEGDLEPSNALVDNVATSLPTASSATLNGRS